MERMKLYEKLVNMNGIAGHERQVRNFVREELEKVSDEIIQDKLGSVFGVNKGTEDGPVIMIAGHMDEVGAMVTKITKEGFIKMIPIGGLDPKVMYSQNVNIVINDEKTIMGVIGAIPPHLTTGGSKELSFDDLLLDVGANSKEDAEAMGIQLGQQIVPVNNYYVMENGNRIVSKAWDNRFGVGMALEIMKEIKGKDHPNTVIGGATVQEEVGLRGAKTASQMVKPDLFIAVDVSPVGDFLGEGNNLAFGKLGEGFLIRFYDPRCIMHEGIRGYFDKLAAEKNIKCQYFLSRGGTDAAEAQYSGAIATTVGLPGRYIHTTAAIIDVRDVEAVKEMLLAIIYNFDKKALEEVNRNV